MSLTDEQKQEIHNQTGAGHALICLVESAATAPLLERIKELEALRKDAERLDWIEGQARARKIEIAKSLLGTGYEIGLHPSLSVYVGSGSLRSVIDAAKEHQ